MFNLDPWITLWGDCSWLINWFQTTAEVTWDLFAAVSSRHTYTGLYTNFLGVGIFKIALIHYTPKARCQPGGGPPEHNRRGRPLEPLWGVAFPCASCHSLCLPEACSRDCRFFRRASLFRAEFWFACLIQGVPVEGGLFASLQVREIVFWFPYHVAQMWIVVSLLCCHILCCCHQWSSSSPTPRGTRCTLLTSNPMFNPRRARGLISHPCTLPLRTPSKITYLFKLHRTT